MIAKNLKFEDFEVEKLTKNQLKIVLGGDDDIDPPGTKEPTKGGGGTGGTP
jgi:hypothetical protein